MNTRAPDPELLDREVTPPDINTLPALMRAEIDSAIATARAFPRSTAEFLREVTALVTLDEETAEACHYALPRKDKDGKKILIEGPSARFAELIQYSWGNNRGGGRVISDEGNYVTAQGTFHDLEKNVQVVMEVKRRITSKTGQRFGDDMIGVTGNAAASIAHRNAVLKAIPKAIWNIAYLRAKGVAVGTMITLGVKRASALEWFAKCNVTPEQIYAKLEIGGLEDIGLEELTLLLGIKTAIKEGARPEEVFAPEGMDTPTKVASFGDRMAARGTKTDATAEHVDTTTGEVHAGAIVPGEPEAHGKPDPVGIRKRVLAAKDVDAIDQAAADISLLPSGAIRDEIRQLYDARRVQLEGAELP
jgi:hypothetical protein